jgi:hypothetical protein
MVKLFKKLIIKFLKINELIINLIEKDSYENRALEYDKNTEFCWKKMLYT